MNEKGMRKEVWFDISTVHPTGIAIEATTLHALGDGEIEWMK